MGESKVGVDYVWGNSRHPSSVDVYCSSLEGTEFDTPVECFDYFIQKLNQFTVSEVFGDEIRYLQLFHLRLQILGESRSDLPLLLLQPG